VSIFVGGVLECGYCADLGCNALLIVVITKTTDDEISPSLHNRINLINTNILSGENLMMARIGRNMLSSSSNKHHLKYLLCY